MATKKAGQKKTEVAQIKKTEILASVGGLSLAGVAEQIAKTQVAVQAKLADVSTQVSASLATLGDVNAAIEAKREELKTLHQIEAAALTLDEINGSIQATREAWDAEQKRAAQAESERLADLAKSRQREADEHAYKTAQERRKKQDEFETTLAVGRKAEAERKEALEKGWAQREAQIKASENELIALRDAVAKFPEEIKKAVDRDVAVATNSLKANLTNTHTLALKDAATDLKLAQQDTANAKLEVTRLTTTIAELHKQLDAAHKASQTVAEKALDSASGRAVAEALQNSMTRSDAGATGGTRR